MKINLIKNKNITFAQNPTAFRHSKIFKMILQDINNKSKMDLELAISKLEGVKDKKIIKIVNKIYDEKENSFLGFRALFITRLLEAYHQRVGHYSILGSNVHNYYLRLKYLIPESKEILTKPKQKNKLFQNYLSDITIKRFNKFSKYDGLISFVDDYSRTTSGNLSKAVDYLYEKYYLNKLPKSSKSTCLKIMKEFDTRIFYFDNEKAPNYILAELKVWKKASNNNFKTPKIINAVPISDKYLGKLMGSCDGKSIDAKNDNSSLVASLRHELCHLNLPEESTEEQIAKFKNIINDQNWIKEFNEAGILSWSLQEYAKTSLREFLAVATQGQIKMYSSEFKKNLMELGLKQWILNLEDSPIVALEMPAKFNFYLKTN